MCYCGLRVSELGALLDYKPRSSATWASSGLRQAL